MSLMLLRSICEEDKDSSILTDLKYRFCEFIRKMIISSDSTDLNFESLAPGNFVIPGPGSIIIFTCKRPASCTY